MRSLKRICVSCSLIVLSIAIAVGQQPDSFGVNIDFTDPKPGELKMLADAGLRWARMDFKWDATEYEPGKYDFAAYDRLLLALEKEHIHALFILDYGNPLYDNGAPPRTDRTRQAFTRWGVAAAKHFSGRGVLWELYNEPNHELFWPPRPNVNEYVKLALVVGKAFQEQTPNEKLIGPATSGIDFEFLETCFKSGLLNYWSGVSVHPYRREDPETVASDYQRLRQLIDSYAVGKPIISGEWGYSTSWENISAAKQGELLLRSWLTNAANGIQLSIWYDWKDDGTDPGNPEHNFGIVANAYRQHAGNPFDPKPAYIAAQSLTGFLTGYKFVGNLPTPYEKVYVLSFKSGDEVRVAAWTTSQSESDVVIPLEGAYQAFEYTGREVGIFRSSQGNLKISLSSTPVYIKKIHKEM
ncbi:MAG TPA: hypothetical protein VI306_23235 [Pyrinomonadaceae bacterium]